jgi:hypothetical protein
MANVKVFADRQTDKQTDGQAKNYMPPIYRYGGIKTGSSVFIKLVKLQCTLTHYVAYLYQILQECFSISDFTFFILLFKR